MYNRGFYLLGFALALLGGGRTVLADAAAPDFQEVYQLLQRHLTDATPQELNRDAVRGLLSAVGPRVKLLGTEPGPDDSDPRLVTRSNLFSSGIAYVRVARVGRELTSVLAKTIQSLRGTNSLTGVILDLRYAGGDDYEAAGAAASLFVDKDLPLLDWGQGMFRSQPGSAAISAPVAVLVNHETSGAAEALAAVLREAGRGLILGGNTAGEAMMSTDYPLSNGGKLRIATGPVRLGDGKSLTGGAVRPDIVVEVSAADERAWFADPLRSGSAAGDLASTNRVARRRFNEAELVRERATGAAPEPGAAAPEPAASAPAITDPTLVRALDLLKGLAVVRQGRA